MLTFNQHLNKKLVTKESFELVNSPGKDVQSAIPVGIQKRSLLEKRLFSGG